MIQNYGRSYPLPDAAVQPDPNLVYKMLFDITKEFEGPDKVNSGLNHIARTINVFEGAGYPLEKMQLAAIVHGKATDLVLKDEQYRKKYSQGNPNIELLKELKQAGVQILLCGQSMQEHGYERNMIVPEVTPALAALTVLPTYQMRGYALMPG